MRNAFEGVINEWNRVSKLGELWDDAYSFMYFIKFFPLELFESKQIIV